MTDTLTEKVGEAALRGLLDRSGIGDELDQIRSSDPEIWQEIVEEVGAAAVATVRQWFAESKK